MTPQQLVPPRILFAGLVFSNVLLIYIAFVVVGQKTSVEWNAVVSAQMSGVGAVMFVVSILLLAASIVLPRAFAKIAARSPARNEGVALTQRAFPPFILGLALAEACTCMGVA